jgi:hypothetical protein
VHASALRQAYQAFLSEGAQIGGAVFALEGTGPADAKTGLIAAAPEYRIATSQFAGHLGPKAQKAWDKLQTGRPIGSLRRRSGRGSTSPSTICRRRSWAISSLPVLP